MPNQQPVNEVSVSKSLFQQFVDGDAPMPRAAATLGAKFQTVDTEVGKVTVEFEATDAFTNPVGNIQGGFLAAMLDDTMGPALVCTLNEGEFAPTLEIKVNFVRPAQIGSLTGYGKVVSKGASICVLEGRLEQNGKLVATGSATALIRKMD